QARHRDGRRRDPAERSRPGDDEPSAAEPGHQALPRPRRQRDRRPADPHPGRLRAPRGLAGVAAGAGEASGRCPLPRPADSRGLTQVYGPRPEPYHQETGLLLRSLLLDLITEVIMLMG